MFAVNSFSIKVRKQAYKLQSFKCYYYSDIDGKPMKNVVVYTIVFNGYYYR